MVKSPRITNPSNPAFESTDSVKDFKPDRMRTSRYSELWKKLVVGADMLTLRKPCTSSEHSISGSNKPTSTTQSNAMSSQTETR